MEIFVKLKSLLTGCLTTREPMAKDLKSDGRNIKIEVTYASRLSESTTEVSDEEVAERLGEHAFILASELSPLRPSEAWWNEESQKRRRLNGSKKKNEWLLPFMPIDTIELPEISNLEQQSYSWGPHSSSDVAKVIRAQIRNRRKSKEPYDELLISLYGACLAEDIFESLSFDGLRSSHLAKFVSLADLGGIRVDYMNIGYQFVNSLRKTDIKWLVEAFGEPAEHQTSQDLWPDIRQDAISRFCWSELRNDNEKAKQCGLPQKSMKQWLEERFRRYIGYDKEWQERTAVYKQKQQELTASLSDAWRAMASRFVVADLETTGLSSEKHEILEFAAVLSDPDGAILKEFSALVSVKDVPPEITRLTGITSEDVRSHGIPLADAFKAFVEFVDSYPIFFHNAPFDHGFIKKAGAQVRVPFSNQVYDTLPMARQAWPKLRTYKLPSLAEHVGAPVPTHRALSDVKSALTVILAARKEAGVSAT
ncbi:MAG: 3'-5' exonuclease [Trichlorobacter sp.]|nr:3'-5' exonuclease [Trichlorobacter sp.]